MTATTHSRVGASGAPRWFACPGSVLEIERCQPEEKTSKYAKHGTGAHWVNEQCLKSDACSPGLWVGEIIESGSDKPFNAEDADACDMFVGLARTLKKNKVILHSEIKFHLDSIHSELFGTCDLAALTPDMRELTILDYKHGAGVPVEVENNKQLLFYALGGIQYACQHYGMSTDLLGWGGVFKRVRLGVVQPRCDHKDGHILLWDVPPQTLDDFADELKKRAEIALTPGAPFKAGDHCRWCPLKFYQLPGTPIRFAECQTFAAQVNEVTKSQFTAIEPVLPAIKTMSVNDMVSAAKFAPLLKEWIDSIHAHLFTLLEQGEKVPGYKLVRKRANRIWTDKEKAIEALELLLSRDEFLALKSPAQVEKALRGAIKPLPKNFVDDYTTKPDNGFTIAPEYDKRKAVDAGFTKID